MVNQGIANFEAAVKKFPKDTHVRLMYGSVLLKQKETGNSQAGLRAEELFRQVLTLDPHSQRAHYELGTLELENGHLASAIRNLETAVQLDDSRGDAHYALARAYRRAGRTQDAAREMRVFENRKRQTDSHAEHMAQDRF
jgi:predicted Zn-dependent protease